MFNPYQQQFSMYQPTMSQISQIPQMTQQNVLPPQQILQANGKASIDAIKMSPNSSVLIADSSAPIVWRCVSDSLGNVTAEAFDIVPHKETPAVDTTSIMAIVKEINDRVTRLEESYDNESTITRKPAERNDAESAKVKADDRNV